METILFLAHTGDGGKLPKLALEALKAAADLSAKISGSAFFVGLIGSDVKAVADSIAGCGASKFFAVEDGEFGVSRYATDALAVEQLVRKAQATLVVAPATSRFSRSVPGAAGRVGGCIDTHVSGLAVVEGKLQINRWYYRQRMLATLGRQQRPWFLLVDSGVFEEYAGSAGAASVEKLSVDVPDACKRTKVSGIQAASAGTQTIRPDAKILFVAGAGWTKKQSDGQTRIKEAEKLILGFLDNAQASLGSSKSLVDQSCEGQEVLHCMSHLNQVGQTGSTPRHPKGLATCCHGEEPHVVGWRFINERRVINMDPNCGWAQGKADVVYVGDAFQVVEKVNELLAKGK
jgi:electron transfer flavoprotein alpha subunit